MSKLTFGLTGGIACGKSTISKTFQAHGIPMVDADVVARDVVALGTRGLTRITDTFGEQYLLLDGTLDRPKLGELVFTDKMAMSILNGIMTPLITEESAKQINKLHDEGHLIVGYDAALICEMGHADLYRPLVVAYCTQEDQIARLISRNSLTREQAVARIQAQMPVELKAHMADQVIYTWGTVEDSIKQTEIYIDTLKKKYL
jgi:dephospho-CoA kinase